MGKYTDIINSIIGIVSGIIVGIGICFWCLFSIAVYLDARDYCDQYYNSTPKFYFGNNSLPRLTCIKNNKQYTKSNWRRYDNTDLYLD